MKKMKIFSLLIIILINLLFIKFNLNSEIIDGLNPNPPSEKVKLVFIHHSTGEDWLNKGDLRKELNKNNYFVVETNYEWGPNDLDVNDGNPIGYHTDVGYWYNWFLGSHKDIYLDALYKSSYTTEPNSISDPKGEAQIVMLKSCFTSLQVIYGNPDDPPLQKGVKNPIYGKGCMDDWAYTVSNIKGLYRDLLDYFKTRQDKLFIIITTPPSLESSVGKELASLLRGINNYLVNDLLKDYPYNNVFVFDYYNVLTSNGGSLLKNDLNLLTGNHHRYRDGKIEHTINYKNDCLAYGSDTDVDGVPDDNHPNPEGHKKATYEFVPLLNIAYNRWKSGGIVVPKTSIDYNPKSIDFGKVEVGKISSSKLVTLKNNGESDIKIDDLKISGKNYDEFLIQNNFCKDKTLKKGEQCTFEVLFKPKSEGLKEGKLIKESDSKIEISLSGEGIKTSTPQTGNIYYVSNSGDNNNPGTKEKPWKTIGFASKKLKPGDTLIILNGEYIVSEYYEDMITPESGLENKWIIIKGEDGSKPKIKGKNGILSAIDISGKNYIKIENLEISSLIDSPYSGGLREGIEAGGSSTPNEGKISNIILKDITIYHTEEVGINFSGNMKNVQLENIHIHHTGGPAISAPSAEGGKGWENVVISNCILEYSGLYSNGKEVRSDWDRPDGIGFENSIGPVEIKNTISRYNFGDGIDSKSKNTYIHECMVANNFGDGVKLWGDGSKVENTLVYGTGYVSKDEVTPWCLLVIDSEDRNGNFEIINCTFFDDENRANNHYTMTIQYENDQIPINLTLKNNIIAGLSRAFIRKVVKLNLENNLFYIRKDDFDIQIEYGDDLISKDRINSFGSNNFYSNPDFVNPVWGPNGDFHLKSSSPAIDKGMLSGSPKIDLEGKIRPYGNGIDIGAYELGGTLPPKPPKPPTPPESKIIIRLYIGKTTYYVNDEMRTMDVAPMILEGRTLLPIRYVAEALGANVGWDGTEKKVTITFKDKFIELWIGNNTARVNGEYKYIDPSDLNVKPIIISGRTMLPIRFIAENLGCKVDWDPNLKEVKITYPGD
jgi:hypothetical protein